MKNRIYLLGIIIAFLAANLFSKSLNLQESINIALENNEDIKTAKNEKENSKYIYKEALSGAFPKIEGHATYLRGLSSSKVTDTGYLFNSLSNGLAELNNTIADLHPSEDIDRMDTVASGDPEVNAMKDNTLKWDIQLVQPLYVGGKVGTAIKIAKIYDKLNKEQYNLSEQKVITSVKKSFYNVLALKEAVKVLNLVQKDADENYKNIEIMYSEGLVSEYDLIRASAYRKSITPKVVETKNNLRLALNDFKTKLGLDLNDEIDLIGDFDENIDIDTEDYLDKALNNRKELKLLEYQKDMLEKNVKIEKGSHYPTLVGIAAYNFQSENNDFSDTFEKNFGVHALSAGLQLNIPIFSGFETTAKVQQAKIQVRNARLSLQKTKKLISLDAQQAYSRILEAREEIDLQNENLREAEKAYKIAKTRYENSLGTQLELVDAQTLVENARLQKISALNKLFQAKFDFELAIGDINSYK